MKPNSDQLDHLDQIAATFGSGNEETARQLFGPLSTGERCYVALAANRPDLLPMDSIAYMVERIGADWLRELINRHKTDTPPPNPIDRLRTENLRLRKIAAHVPGNVYIAAKEAAGYATEIKPVGT